MKFNDLPEARDDNLTTCLNFIRQTRDHLLENNPVKAYNSLARAEKWARKLNDK